MTGDIEPRDIRVSDAEREHIGELLQRAVGQGRITVSEFDERMKVAMAARTRGELNSVVIDIAEASPVPAVQAKKSIVIKSSLGDVTRRGYWVVPEQIKVEGGVGDTTLDFTRAEFTAPVTTIDVKLGVGDLRIVVPVGAVVDVDDMHVSVGSVKDRTTRTPGDRGPHIVLRGRSTMGDVVVQHAKSWRLGPMTIHSPFRVTWGPDKD